MVTPKTTAITTPELVFTPEQQALCDRLENFKLDQADAELSFSKRLVQDNNWSLNFAEQAIDEYKKFMFLALAASHPVTPSDAVDQVWHLHLSYSRSYWENFCPNVLLKSLHHEPTKGGESEAEKYNNWYNQTLESYTKFFGEPPDHIWPDSDIRFGQDLAFQRINLTENLVFKKTYVIQFGAIALLSFLEIIVTLIYFAQPDHFLSIFMLLSYLFLAIGLNYSFVKFVHDFVVAATNPKPHGYGGCSLSADGGCAVGGCGGCGGH